MTHGDAIPMPGTATTGGQATGRTVTRRAVLTAAAAAAAGGAVAGISSQPALGQQAAGSARPNVIIINCDDLAYSVYEASASLRRTLEDRGRRFANAIANVPSCGPSRACLFTGRYPHNHGVMSNTAPDGGWQVYRARGNEEDNVAVRLRRAGYRTGLIGKYLNDYELGDIEHVPPGWSEWHAWVGRGKYDRYMVNDNGVVSFYDIRDDPSNYETDRYTIMAQEFIAGSKGGDPFFLYLAPHAPHMPAAPSKTYRKADAPATGPRTPAINESDVSDKPAWVRNAPLLSAAKIRRSDRRFQDQVRSMESVNDMVVAVLRTLEETGQIGNTWIFFTSDNGFYYGEHRIPSGKGSLYEEGIRVPFVALGPGLRPGQTGTIISAIDIAPTVLALAGVAAPDLDGRSFKNVLEATGTITPGTPTMIQYGISPFVDAPATRMVEDDPLRGGTLYGLRGTDWTYISVIGTGEHELYDIRNDRQQLVNIYDTKISDNARELLRQTLVAMTTCRGETCRAISSSVPATLGLWYEMP